MEISLLDKQKQAMASSPFSQHAESIRTKGNLKAALIKRPKSIHSLKKSLFINHSNLDEFVKYMKDPPQTFHNNFRQAEIESPSLLAQVNGLKNIVKNIGMDANGKGKQIFMGRKARHKQFKKQLKIQRSEFKFNVEPDEEHQSLSHSLYRANTSANSKFRLSAIQNKGFKNPHKNGNNRKMKFRNTFSVSTFKDQAQNTSFTYSKFWKKEPKQTHRKRWATEGDDKREKGLGELTQYCQKKNMKGVNYLMLQLQLNVEDSKRIKKTTQLVS